MIQRSDIKGRLNLLRYGLVVLVVVTFFVALLVPVGAFRNLEGVDLPPITEFVDEALIATVIVAILSVPVYFGYSRLLHRTVVEKKSESTP